MNERDLVLSMLMEIEKGNEYSHILIRQVLDKYDYLEGHQKRFIKRLTEGTLERRLEMDYILNLFSSVKTNKMKPLIRNLLRMSVYQIFYMTQIPESAICNEAVKLASLHKFSSLKGFINGVLRNIIRKKEEISFPQKEVDFLSYIEVSYSIPRWLIEHFLQYYSKQEVEAICKGLLKEQPVSIRIREDISGEKREQLLDAWRAKGALCESHPYLSYAYYLEKTEGISSLEGFEEGDFAVQDVSSMLVAEVAGIKKDMFLLDLCAAPGGKSTHAALKLAGTGKVLARDLTEYKVRIIEENRNRQRLDNLVTEVWDATIFDHEKEETADIVFCDVPCSGLGVMAKKPDIKFRIQKEDLKSLTKLQKEILKNAVKYIKKDGILIYSTCTINREENEEQVKWMTQELGMEVVSLKEALPNPLKNEAGELGLQLLPGIHETDGFFISKLKKRT